jgi:hypothetical protein
LTPQEVADRAALGDNGYNVASVLSPLWANHAVCKGGETPLACEARLHNPSIVIINMETWWQHRPASEYENYLDQIVQLTRGSTRRHHDQGFYVPGSTFVVSRAEFVVLTPWNLEPRT